MPQIGQDQLDLDFAGKWFSLFSWPSSFLDSQILMILVIRMIFITQDENIWEIKWFLIEIMQCS